MQSLRSILNGRATAALAVLAVGMCGGLVAGCGDDAEPAADETPTISVPTAATTAETVATATTTATATVRTPPAVTSPTTTPVTPPRTTTTPEAPNPGGVAAPDDNGGSNATTTPRQDPDCRPGTGPGQPLPQCEPVSGPDANEDEG